ncbi:uclacyanin-3-like [Aristolochia californica]|uniref:uclacyanin-3-like n=1 Tax=Aristolochia californica TaxID=171875 RepID=UPI0035DCCDE3
MAAATAFVLLLLAAPLAHAADYVVGDSSGWDTGVNFPTWTSGKTFQVGDRLIFTYTANHKVDEVTKSDYDSCSSANTLASHDDGNTTITLSKEGGHYFLCPTFGHCGQGMKLSVTVSAAGSSPSTPTTPGGSPSTPSTPNSPSTPGSRTPSSTPSGASSLTAIGACLLWAPILAFMS